MEIRNWRNYVLHRGVTKRELKKEGNVEEKEIKKKENMCVKKRERRSREGA